MKHITEITKEQEAQMSKYVDKWVNIGTSTSRLSGPTVSNIVGSLRELLDMKSQYEPIIIVDNPLEAWVVCTLILTYDVSVDDVQVEMESVFNGNPKKYDIPRCELPWMTGSFFASTFAFYDYMITELGVELDRELWTKYKMWEASAKLGCVYPLDTVTIVSEKPTHIYLEDGKLHKEGSPALIYNGFGDIKIWSLHGVEVPEWLAKTSSHELTLEDYSKLTNADVKAEFIRKVGIERFIDQGEVIDSYTSYNKDTHDWWYKSEYELIDMSALFSTLDYAPYLKMVNQTTKIFHMEGISPECSTVEEALKERFGGKNFVIESIA
jgi:hypothetical protein